ncbi:MATE family efflux transporter [Enterovibrio coralii]|uniref:MATE family efflux transporter n=1 Tax=Enterovibrio coralii TaxID=294935 RepID=UPI000AA15E17|nr:MATE family efflux transporter [Enterovibrio coralii]
MNNALLEKPIGSALVFMAAPTAIGMLLTFLFQLVDTYFIGQLGVKSLTAISFTYPVYILIVGFFMGIAAGVSAVVGKLLGEKETSRAAYLIVLSLCLFAVISGGVGVSGYLMAQHCLKC